MGGTYSKAEKSSSRMDPSFIMWRAVVAPEGGRLLSSTDGSPETQHSLRCKCNSVNCWQNCGQANLSGRTRPILMTASDLLEMHSPPPSYHGPRSSQQPQQLGTRLINFCPEVSPAGECCRASCSHKYLKQPKGIHYGCGEG